uniref:Uncharacterized protein n=1 Tax=Plectus sambesii TaxID=2011161 RepID=A0A914VT24_9BILA
MSLPSAGAVSAAEDSMDSLGSSESTLIDSVSRKSSRALLPPASPPAVVGSKKQSFADSGYGGSHYVLKADATAPSTSATDAHHIELVITD